MYKLKLNHKIIIIALLLVAIVVVAIISIVNRPAALKVSTQFATNPDDTISSFSGVKFNAAAPVLPSLLPILSITDATNNTNDVIGKMITTYDLQVIMPDNLWRNDENGVILSQQELGCYTLNFSQPTSSLPGNWQEQTLIQTGNDFLKSWLGANENVVAQTNRIAYLSGLDYGEPTVPSQANVAIVPYTYSFNNFPVYYRKSLVPPFSVYFNNQEEIYRLAFCPQFFAFAQQETMPIISIDQAVTNINSRRGAASLLLAAQENFADFDIANFHGGELTSVAVEYRLDETAGLAYPFYRFAGTLTDSANLPVEVELITPAINTSF